MNGLELCKSWKHWRTSPGHISFTRSLDHRLLNSPTIDPASPEEIHVQAIITPQLKTKIKKGGRV